MKRYILLTLMQFGLIGIASAACNSVTTIDTSPTATKKLSTNNVTPVSGTVKISGGTSPFKYTVSTQPSNGTVSINATTGNWTYTPSNTFVGNDSFSISVAPTCKTSLTKKVNVSTAVSAPPAPVCTAPTVASIPDIQAQPGVPATGSVSASGGTPPYVYSGTIITNAANAGSFAIDSATGSFTYTAGNTYNGLFYYSVTVASSCDLTKSTTQIGEYIVVKPDPAGCTAPTLPATASFITKMNTAHKSNAAVTMGSLPIGWTLSTAPAHGTVSLDFMSGTFTYTPAANYLGNDSFVIRVGNATCGYAETTFSVKVQGASYVSGTYQNPPATGNIAAGGGVIIDNTPNPGTAGIMGNMGASVNGNANYAIANAFNIDSIQVMQRDTSTTPHSLVDEAGVNNRNGTSFNNYGTSKQLNYFSNGQHLFDLNRFIVAADWLSSNVVPSTAANYAAHCKYPTIPVSSGVAVPSNGGRWAIGNRDCHPAGTYGTISWDQFLENVVNNKTMWGIVHVKVPLELGKVVGSNNALNQTIGKTNIYGFCTSTTGLCSNSPDKNTSLEQGKKVTGKYTLAGGYTIPANAVIKVRGAIFFDYVNAYADAIYPVAGTSIGFDHLPFDAEEIFFNIFMPLNVNASNDKNDDGIMDNIDYINSLTAGINCGSYPCTTVIPDSTSFNSAQSPKEAVDYYNYTYGKNYVGATDSAYITLFNGMNKPNQYHMLMPTGYEQGWADAFAELDVTAGQWAALDFSVPASAATGSPLGINDIRDPAFEDLPVYLFNGGLMSLEGDMNISGLIYIPQAILIEQEVSATRQYISGAIIVRDGFSIEGQGGPGITLISSNPAALASMRVNISAVTGATLTQATTSMHSTNSINQSSPIGAGVGSGSGIVTTDIVGSTSQAAFVGRSKFIEVKAH